MATTSTRRRSLLVPAGTWRNPVATTTGRETGWRGRVNRGCDDGPPLVAGGVGALLAVEHRTLRPNGPLVGIALRYGFFYGPGTWFHPDGDVAAQLRAGRFPVLGTGAGRWSFVHIDDAVAATVAAVESDLPGAFNICDDDPVALRQWLPTFARYLGAPPPAHVPIGPDGDPDSRFYTELLRGADNHLARHELGFDPRPLPWR